MLKQLRYLFTLMLLAVAGVGFAGSITFGDLGLENGVQYTEPFDGGDFTVTFAGGENDGKYYTTGSGVRVYGNGTMTISAKSGTLTSITITYDGTNKPENGDVVSTGSYDATTGVWTGSAKEVVFTRPTGKGHWRVQKVEVTIEGGVNKEAAGLSFGENTSFEVEPSGLFTAPELENPNGLEVTYSSSDEDVAWVDELTGDVGIGGKEGTATITARSKETDDFYAGSASYTITVKVPVQALPNIAELSLQIEAGEYEVVLNDAVVTYVNGNYAYIQDESGAIVMYKKDHGLIAGQVLSGTATVKYQVRNGNPQITDISDYTAGEGTAPNPTEIIASDWNTPIASVLSQYFKIKCATITKENNKYYVQLGDEKVQLYGQGAANPISVASLDPTYTIVGFPTLYNSTVELQIFEQPEAEQMVLVVPTPTFNPAAGNVQAGTTVEIVCPDDVDGVEYSFDQETWTEYTAPIEITETTTVYARSYNEAGNKSEVVSAKYTVVETTDVVIEEDGKTTFLFNTPGNEWGFPTDYSTDAAEFTANGKTIEVGGPEGYKYNTSDKYLIFGKTGAYITLPAFDFPVGKIEVVGREAASGNTKQNIFVGETAISTETTGAKETNEYSIPTIYQEAGTVYTLKVTNNYNSQVTQIIVYKADGTVELADPELAYDVEEFTATIGEDNEFPVLANPNELEVTYISSNEEVATIDAEGNITLVGAGETTITATSEANDVYKAGEASYVLTVEEAEPVDEGNCYVKVTSTQDLVDGTYIIVYEDGSLAFDGGLKTLDAVNNYIDVNILGDKVVATDEVNAASFTIKATEEGYSIKSASGLYIGNTSDANALKSSNETAYTNTITIDEGGANVVSAGSYLRFNSASNQMRFRYYKSASYTGQKAIQLYRKVQLDGITVPVTIGSTGYATLYYGTVDLEIPEGVTASIVTAVNDKVIVTENLDGIIPAGTGVVLQGEAGDYEFAVVESDEETPEGNLLNGSDKKATTEGGDIYYMLSVKNDEVGFYWGAEEGGAFLNGAHKAYLALPAGASNAKFFILGTADGLVSEDGGFVDGINEVKAESKQEYYNLNGTRVNTLRKGIYIVGGKKVVIK